MFVIGAVIAFLLSASPQNMVAAQRIVAASNVRLRSAPQATAEELTRLPLGTILTELEASPDAAWFRVQTPEGTTGWMFGSLTEPYSERHATETYRKIMQTRLKVENLSFPAAAELVEFITKIAGNEQDPALAEFDLFQLQALDRSLREITRYEPRDPAHRDWIKKHEDELNYNEPGGVWWVRADLYWELEKKHRGKPIADEIAWDGANAGIPGECEGYIPCTLAVLLMTDGRYLQLYPAGRHAAEAMEFIDAPLQEMLKPDTPYTMDSRESAELRESITKLSAILERISSPQAAGILARLKRIEQTYR